MKKLTTILMIAVIAIMASCSKEGPAGPAGTNGTNGTNGVDGNANVQVFLWNTSPTSTGSGPYTTTYNISAITQDILDRGAVLMYIETNSNSNVWLAVPFSNETVWFYTRIKIGLVELLSKNTMITAANTRVVVIGGTTNGLTTVNRNRSWSTLNEIEKAQSLYPNVDFSSYDAVKTAFNLKK